MMAKGPERQKLERVLKAYTTELSNEDNAIRLSQKSVTEKSVSTDNDEPSETDDDVDRKWSFTFSLQNVLFGAFFFLTSGALNMLRPYLSVYYRQLGLNVQEIGIIRSVQPWIAIPWTPLMGYLSAKFSIRKVMLIGSLLGTAGIYMGQYIVPEVRRGDCTLLHMCVEPQDRTGLEHVTTDAAVTFMQYDENNLQNNVKLSTGSNLSKACPYSQTTRNIEYWYNNNDIRRLVIYLILINVACQILGAAWNPLANAVVLEALGKDKRNQFAYFKAFGAISSALSVWIAGLLLDTTRYTVTHCGTTAEHANYFVCFATFSTLMVLAIPVAMAMSPSQDRTGDLSSNTRKEYHIVEVFYSLCNVRYGSVLLTVLWLAIATGKMRIFDNWYVEFLGGSFTLMAWGGLIGQSSMIVTFFALPLVNDKVGHIPVLVMACIATGVGCVVSGFISNPAWMMIPMFLREMSVAVYMQTSGAYFSDATESHNMTSMQTIMSSVTYGLGKGIGSLLGGGLFQTISPTRTYVIFAVASFAFALFLLVTHLLLETIVKGIGYKEYNPLFNSKYDDQ